MTQPHEEALDAALAAFEAARDALNVAAAAYAAEECRRLSRQLKRRRVTWFASMGMATVEIARRRPLEHGAMNERERYVHGYIYNNAFPFQTRLDEIESDTRINGLGAGVFHFMDGEAVEEA